MLTEILDHFFDLALISAFALSSLYFIITLIALTTRTMQSKHYTTAPDDVLPEITVQIPTYNELAALHCARRVLQFDYPEDRLQIIIGDDSNQRHVSAAIDAFAKLHPRIEVSRRGSNIGYKPGNLNAMLPLSTGAYILILDSDFLPKKDFLKRLIEPVLKDPALSGVQASWRVINVHHNFSTLMGTGIINVIHSILMPFMYKLTSHALFCGSGELVRKKDLIELGGWTEGALTEDVDYSLRLISSGRRIAYLDQLRIRCEVPYTAGDLFKQQMRWAYGVVRAFMQHGTSLFLSRITQKRVKLAALIFSSGYIMITLLLFTMLFGLLNFIAGFFGVDPAAHPSSSYHIGHFLYDSTLNLLLTGGMLLSSLAACFVNGFGLRSLGKLLLAALTIGVACMFFVGRGILSAWMGLPMPWFMMKKAGNERVA
jgi:cellulose synthase/poly-beta-1,6-N-acetylglucosamine synthase-like glycosyltransferase